MDRDGITRSIDFVAKIENTHQIIKTKKENSLHMEFTKFEKPNINDIQIDKKREKNNLILAHKTVKDHLKN